MGGNLNRAKRGRTRGKHDLGGNIFTKRVHKETWPKKFKKANIAPARYGWDYGKPITRIGKGES